MKGSGDSTQSHTLVGVQHQQWTVVI